MLSRSARLAAVSVMMIELGALGGPHSAPVASGASPIVVVAAENFYGDIVGQIGGDHVVVTSIISDPTVDPHEYESNARDGVAVADACLVVQNGIGYDEFMNRLEAASSPNPRRRVIVVADLTGHRKGDNPHLWYDPPTVPRVAEAVLDALVQIDPGDAGSYRNGHRAFRASLTPLNEAVASIKARYHGTAVALTEPVFSYMAAALGLNVVTPLAFQKAIEEGEDPPAAALAQMEDQLKGHQAKLLLYNTQTVSPITLGIQALAKRVGVPVVGVSETKPPKKSFQQWMLSQLDAVRAALAQGN
ncbi:MAG TPA: zinc ABC transporter substrate-binding protein [bacterium]|nr:zinc ABC transporter substrate-binding protein [bacterium]